MAKSDRNVVGLDIGTSSICCVVAEVHEGGAVEAVGLGSAPSRGMRKGVVVNPEATVEAIRAAVQEAELMSSLTVQRATVGIAGGHIRSFNSRGVVAVSGKDGTVARDDVKRVLDAARAVSIPQDREILHVLPQEFVLDEQRDISSPVGMIGQRLEANVHIVTAASNSLQNLVSCVNRAGLEVKDTVLEQLAASEAVLSADEKDLGVALVDIGGGTTDLALFERGSIWHTAVLPVGGEHFTNDLAVGLRTPIPDAERLKKRYGCALSSLVEENEAVEVPTVGGRKPRLLSRQVMAEILQPRAEEIFALVQEEIVRAGFEKLLNAGVVLTGGGGLLPGVLEVAEQVFGVPVRRGHPAGVDGLHESNQGPEWCTAVGLALYAARHQGKEERPTYPVAPFLAGLTGRLRTWFGGSVSRVRVQKENA